MLHPALGLPTRCCKHGLIPWGCCRGSVHHPGRIPNTFPSSQLGRGFSQQTITHHHSHPAQCQLSPTGQQQHRHSSTQPCSFSKGRTSPDPHAPRSDLKTSRQLSPPVQLQPHRHQNGSHPHNHSLTTGKGHDRDNESSCLPMRNAGHSRADQARKHSNQSLVQSGNKLPRKHESPRKLSGAAGSMQKQSQAQLSQLRGSMQQTQAGVFGGDMKKRPKPARPGRNCILLAMIILSICSHQHEGFMMASAPLL